MIAALLLATQVVHPPSAADARRAMERGRAWLLAHQNEDGSWGGWGDPGAYDGEWSNPETHRSWQAGTTGVACIGLLDCPANPPTQRAIDRGLDFLLAHAMVKRPSDWDTDNVWAYVYGLAALVRAAADPRYAGEDSTARRMAFREGGERLMDRLNAYQTPQGGWAYYADETKAERPFWANSFTTAVVVLDLLQARSLGWNVDSRRLARAVGILEHCRLPSGAYTYNVEPFPTPGGPGNIDQVRGSLGRIQVCNLALYRARRAGFQTPIGLPELREGLRAFFGEHRFLDLAFQRPIPHEAWYYNSGYFYFFGHHYAAGVLAALPAADRARWAPQLWRHILKTQDPDGSMFDYYMNDYGRPYGVGFAISALARTLPPAPAAPAPARSR